MKAIRTLATDGRHVWGRGVEFNSDDGRSCVGVLVDHSAAVFVIRGMVVPLNQAAFDATVVLHPRPDILAQLREACRVTELETVVRALK